MVLPLTEGTATILRIQAKHIAAGEAVFAARQEALGAEETFMSQLRELSNVSAILQLSALRRMTKQQKVKTPHSHTFALNSTRYQYQRSRQECAFGHSKTI